MNIITKFDANPEKRKHFKEQGYSDQEIKIILRLEHNAELMNDALISRKTKFDEDDLDVFFEFVYEVETDTDITDERIKTYAEYFAGAALPFLDQNLKETELISCDEIEMVKNGKDWVSLIETFEKMEIVFGNKGIKIKTMGLLMQYATHSLYPWAMCLGFWHHWFIKNLNK